MIADKLTLSRKFLLLIGVPLCFEMCLLFSLWGLKIQTEQLATRVEHSRELVRLTSKIIRALYSTGTVLFETGLSDLDRVELAAKETSSDIDKILRQLAELTTQDPEEQDSVTRITHLVRIGENFVAPDTWSSEGNKELAFRERCRAFKLLDRIIKELERIETKEERQIKIRQSDWARSDMIQRWIVCLGAISSVGLSIVIAKVFYQSVISRLSIISHNAKNLAENKPLLPQQTGGDEIANVDASFHLMAKRLEEVENLKQQFITMITHDLRSPLTTQQFFLGMITSGYFDQEPETLKTRASVVTSDLNRLIALIGNLLDLEKMEANKLSLAPTTVEIASLLDRALVSVSGLSQAKRLITKLDVPEHAQVQVDEDRIVQVLVNILSNAVKFSPKEGEISIIVRREDANWLIEISDEGPGLPQEFQARMFNRFEQASLDSARVHGGSGLGLAISKLLVEAHKGTLSAKCLDSGSCFTIALPGCPLPESAVQISSTHGLDADNRK